MRNQKNNVTNRKIFAKLAKAVWRWRRQTKPFGFPFPNRFVWYFKFSMCPMLCHITYRHVCLVLFWHLQNDTASVHLRLFQTCMSDMAVSLCILFSNGAPLLSTVFIFSGSTVSLATLFFLFEFDASYKARSPMEFLAEWVFVDTINNVNRIYIATTKNHKTKGLGELNSMLFPPFSFSIALTLSIQVLTSYVNFFLFRQKTIEDLKRVQAERTHFKIPKYSLLNTVNCRQFEMLRCTVHRAWGVRLFVCKRKVLEFLASVIWDRFLRAIVHNNGNSDTKTTRYHKHRNSNVQVEKP